MTGLLADHETWQQGVRDRWSAARRPWGVYARALLPHPMRVLRLQHLHGRRVVAGSVAGDVRGPTHRRGSPHPGLPGGSDRPIDTVFFGGGTPTLLPATDLVAVLASSPKPSGSPRTWKSPRRPIRTASTSSTSTSCDRWFHQAQP